MSIASQQRVIEERDATIRSLREELRQAKVDGHVHRLLVDLCDEYEVSGLKVIPVATLRGLRPKHHGVYGGQPLTQAPEGDEDA